MLNASLTTLDPAKEADDAASKAAVARGSTTAPRSASGLFHDLLEESSKEEKAIIFVPFPSLDDASIAAIADDNVGSNWWQGFFWVDL